MLSEEQKSQHEQLRLLAINNAKQVLKPGDRIRVMKCPGTKRWIIFDHWDGNWIVSRSGITDYWPLSIDRLNGNRVDFSKIRA